MMPGRSTSTGDIDPTAGAGGRPDYVVTAAITGGPALTSPLDSGWLLIEHMFIG